MSKPISQVEETLPPDPSQRAAFKWLLHRARPAGAWIGLSAGLGLAGGFLLIAQAALLAGIFHLAAVRRTPAGELLPLFGIAAAVILTRAVAAWIREEAGFTAGARVREQIRSAMLERLFDLGPAHAAGRRSGALSAAVLERVEALHDFYARYLPQLAIAAAVPAAILAFVFPISWAAGGLLLFTAPLIPLFMVLVGMGAESISQKHYEALSRLGAQFLDILRGIESLKRFGRSRGRSAAISHSSEQYRRRTMGVLRIAFLSSAVLEFFSSIAIALVAVYLGLTYLGYLDFGLYGKKLTLEKGLFILLLAPEFYLPLRELGASYHARAEAIGAVAKIRQLLDASCPAAGGSAGVPVLPPGSIRFEEVCFAHQGERSAVLSGIDLVLTPGRRTFLLGGSGEGKTTLLYLLMQFVAPTSGRILVDGRPLSEISPDAWRGQISWVGQEPRLVAGTVRENILLGRPEATDAAVRAAAQIAHVAEFTSRLPNGLDEDTGEGGRLLSRGQAQRVALARAVLADAPVLLLDEPLAGLDAETERKVEATLEAICREKTVLWVTHRLAAVGPDDRLLLLAGGRVREASIEELRPGSAGR